MSRLGEQVSMSMWIWLYWSCLWNRHRWMWKVSLWVDCVYFKHLQNWTKFDN